MQDFGGCLSFHIVSGMAAMISCYIIKPRLGRFDPLLIKKNFEDDDNTVYLSTYQITLHQEKLDKIASSIETNFDRDFL